MPVAVQQKFKPIRGGKNPKICSFILLFHHQSNFFNPKYVGEKI